MEEALPKERFKMNDEKRHPLGNGGKQIVEPQSEREIAQVLAYANRHHQTVNIISGGTKRGFGGIMENADMLLSLAQYKGIVEHSAGDLTMTVKPGTTLKEIADDLHQHGQRVSLDAPWPEMATIGGVIAANDSGPKRLLYGSARDFVIGLRIVYPDGKVIRTGGKVVKNVAGYDMNKLFIGSMGTLGVISELTIKLRPLPKYEGLTLIHFKAGNHDIIRQFAVRLLDSMLEPVSLELLNPVLSERLTEKALPALAIAFEDRKGAVLYQEAWVKDHLPEGTELTVLHNEEAERWWNHFQKIAPNGRDDVNNLAETKAALKIGSKNMDVFTNIKAADELAKTFRVTVEAHGGLGHGISRVYAKGFPEDIVSYIRAFRSKVEETNGFVICTHLPFSLRRTIDVWGEKPAYFSILEGIKQTNDPKQILNRHRFVGGL